MRLIKTVFVPCVLGFFFSLSIDTPLNASEVSDEEKLQNAQKMTIGDRTLVMKGMGLTRRVSGDYYIAAFYMDESAQGTTEDDLVYLETARSMKYRFVSERKVSARSFSRKIAESIRINNESKDIKLEGKNINKFLGLFKGSYKKGDEIRFDYHNKKGTLVFLNNKLLGEFRRSAKLYTLLLNTWIGKKPPSNDFKVGILGRNPSNEDALKLLRRFEFLD